MLKSKINAEVAVIMCVYAGDSLHRTTEAVASILSQTIRSDIYIFVDGPISSDLQLYLSELSRSKINVTLHQSDYNVGLARGLNTLIQLVIDYEYIARMDADDISLPNRLQVQVDFLKSNPDVSVVGSWAIEFGVKYCKILKKPCNHDDILSFSAYSSPFIHPTVLFDARVFREGHRYPESTYLTEDLALWYILIKENYKFANIGSVLLKYRTSKEMMLRRSGFAKGISELLVRSSYVRRQYGLITHRHFYPLFRLIFAITPISIKRIIYSLRIKFLNHLTEK